jgi:predicted thioesterase
VTVKEGDTAIALGSGDVPVLATPRVVALCEAATVAAARPHLPPGWITVGTRVEVDHLRATAIGATVIARAEVVEVTGRSVRFRVEIAERGAIVAAGAVTRALVDRARFLGRLGG